MLKQSFYNSSILQFEEELQNHAISKSAIPHSALSTTYANPQPFFKNIARI
jgi:hypothetical protein